MSPVTHFLVSWAGANAPREITRRDRALITLAGVAPDLDGLTVFVDFATRGSANPTNWFGQYHHNICHNLPFGILVSALCAALGKNRIKAAIFGFLIFHLHLLCDLIGSGGTAGEIWDIPYLLPFTRTCTITWSGQWALNAWPNFVVTAATIWLTFTLAAKRGYSPLEIVSPQADAAFVRTVRKWYRMDMPGVAK